MEKCISRYKGCTVILMRVNMEICIQCGTDFSYIWNGSTQRRHYWSWRKLERILTILKWGSSVGSRNDHTFELMIMTPTTTNIDGILTNFQKDPVPSSACVPAKHIMQLYNTFLYCRNSIITNYVRRHECA